MNPLARYTGLAYSFDRYNCWDHVRRVRADFQIETPDFDCTSPLRENDAFNAARAKSKGMKQVDNPINYCAVLIGTERKGRIIWHSGIYLDGMVSHCERIAGQVRMQSLDELKRKAARIEFWY